MLDPTNVEYNIAKGVADGRKGDGGEQVFIKASGKAIPRALEVGNYFQRESDCCVRINIGSMRVIDDIDLDDSANNGRIEGGNMREMHLNGDGAGAGSDKKITGKNTARRDKHWVHDDYVPETRIRTLSVVTLTIGLR